MHQSRPDIEVAASHRSTSIPKLYDLFRRTLIQAAYFHQNITVIRYTVPSSTHILKS